MQVKPGAHTPRRSIKTILKMLFCCPSAYCIPYLRPEEVSCIQAFSAASFLNQQEVSEHTDLGRSEKVQSLLTFSLISFCCPPQSPTWLTSTAAVPYSTGSTRSPPAQWKMWFPWDSGAIRQKGFWFMERDREEISSLWSFREEDLFCILIWVREKEGLDTIQIDLISFYSHSCTRVSMDQKVKLEIKENNLRCSEFRCMPELFAFKGIVQPKI